MPPPGFEPVCPGAVAELSPEPVVGVVAGAAAVVAVRARAGGACRRCRLVGVGAGTAAPPGARRSLVAGISGLARLRPRDDVIVLPPSPPDPAACPAPADPEASAGVDDAGSDLPPATGFGRSIGHRRRRRRPPAPRQRRPKRP